MLNITNMKEYQPVRGKISNLPPAARNLFEKRFLDFQKLLIILTKTFNKNFREVQEPLL